MRSSLSDFRKRNGPNIFNVCMWFQTKVDFIAWERFWVPDTVYFPENWPGEGSGRRTSYASPRTSPGNVLGARHGMFRRESSPRCLAKCLQGATYVRRP